ARGDRQQGPVRHGGAVPAADAVRAVADVPAAARATDDVPPAQGRGDAVRRDGRRRRPGGSAPAGRGGRAGGGGWAVRRAGGGGRWRPSGGCRTSRRVSPA